MPRHLHHRDFSGPIIHRDPGTRTTGRFIEFFGFDPNAKRILSNVRILAAVARSHVIALGDHVLGRQHALRAHGDGDWHPSPAVARACYAVISACRAVLLPLRNKQTVIGGLAGLSCIKRVLGTRTDHNRPLSWALRASQPHTRRRVLCMSRVVLSAWRDGIPYLALRAGLATLRCASSGRRARAHPMVRPTRGPKDPCHPCRPPKFASRAVGRRNALPGETRINSFNYRVIQ